MNMYRVRVIASMSVLARSNRLGSAIIKQSGRYNHFMQTRCLTGKFMPLYKTVDFKVAVKKSLRMATPVVPCAFNSITPMDLAKDIAAVKNADGHLYLYEHFKNSPGMTQVNRITILHRLAKFAVSSPKKNFTSTKKMLKEQHHVFLDLLTNIAADFGKCKPRDLASIVWALGKLRENVVWFVTECEQEIMKRDVNSFMAPAVCQLLNGFASLGMNRSQFFTHVEQRILEGKLNLKDFENRGLSGALWSFIKTGNGSQELFEKFKEEILHRDVKSFSSRQLAQFLWSFTEKDMYCDILFEFIEREIQDRPVEDQTDHGIKMILWSLAKAQTGQIDNFDLFNRLGEEVLARGIHDFDNGELAMLVWSFAKKCPKMDSIFDFVEEEINLRDISKFRNHELSLLLWSFAKSGNVSADLFKICQEEILSRDLSLFQADQLSQLAWAFGKAEIPSSDFYSSMEKVVSGNMSKFSDNELCMVARGFAQASPGTQKLFKKFEEEVLERNMPENRPDFIPELAWIFSKCSYKAALLFDEMEKSLKSQGRNFYKDHELKIINSSFAKVGRDLPFVKHKKEGGSKVGAKSKL